MGGGWILLDAEWEEQEEVVRLSPVRCERVPPAHNCQSVTSRPAIINRAANKHSKNHSKVETWSLAAASTTGMTGSSHSLLMTPPPQLGVALRAGVGCHMDHNQVWQNHSYWEKKKREKHPGLTTSDQLLALVLLDTCVPNCCSGFFFSFDATVCAASGLQLDFESGFSTSCKKVFFKWTKKKIVLVPTDIRLSSVLWRHRVNRHGQISLLFIFKIALNKFFIILRWNDGTLVSKLVITRPKKKKLEQKEQISPWNCNYFESELRDWFALSYRVSDVRHRWSSNPEKFRVV